MKIRKFLFNLWNAIQNGSNHQLLKVIYTCAIIAMFLLVNLFRIHPNFPDTKTYFSAGELLCNGIIDELRTPVYPLLCHLAKTLWSSHPAIIVAAVQIAVFLSSISVMYNMCKLFIVSKSIRFVVSLIYACLPCFSLWTLCVLTESFSICFLLAFCYTVVLCCKKTKKRYSAYYFVLLLLLLFIRPIFIFLIPIAFILWIYVLLKDGKNCTIILNFSFTILASMAFAGYCKAFEDRYGYLATSSVSTHNQYYILRQADIVDTTLIENVRMRHDVMHYLDSIPADSAHHFEIEELRNKYEDKALHEFTSANIKVHIVPYSIFSLQKFKRLYGDFALTYRYCKIRIPFVATTIISAFNFFANITLRALCLWLFTTGFIFIVLGFKRHKMPIMSLFLWIIAVANVFSAIVGAQAEYARLIVPCMPLVLIITAMIADMLTVRIKKNIPIH